MERAVDIAQTFTPDGEPIDDLRIVAVRPLLPPAILIEEVPQTPETATFVAHARQDVCGVVAGHDPRLLVVVGPCSVHDTAAALDYAARLRPVADALSGQLLIAMRAYFEKPRTVLGWKGLINDPDQDESFQINKGLRLARRFLHDLALLGLPAATEYLDMTVPQHIADLVSWGAIGARTVESQTHRELASGLSMPIGFKNTTEGDIRAAVDAVRTARSQHWFPSNTKQGVAAIFQTTGNPYGHVILRGGSKSGPNFDDEHVTKACDLLAGAGLRPSVMVDCSHGNSRKDFRKQGEVAANLAAQLGSGSPRIMGVMLESFLVEGRQDWSPAGSTYGQSVTDACLGWDDTVRVLEGLAEAVRDGRGL